MYLHLKIILCLILYEGGNVDDVSAIIGVKLPV